MINEIINSFLVTKLSQEQVDLSEDIEQLQKTLMILEKNLC